MWRFLQLTFEPIGNSKHLLLNGVFVVVVTWGFSQNQLVITIENIKDSEGEISVALFDSEVSYLERPYVGKSVPAISGSTVVVFEDLQPGGYAVSVIHDSNKNGELDKNFFGIPTEGFGFLNGVMGRFGPPKFDQTKVIWTGEKQNVKVPLKYF